MTTYSTNSYSYSRYCTFFQNWSTYLFTVVYNNQMRMTLAWLDAFEFSELFFSKKKSNANDKRQTAAPIKKHQFSLFENTKNVPLNVCLLLCIYVCSTCYRSARWCVASFSKRKCVFSATFSTSFHAGKKQAGKREKMWETVERRILLLSTPLSVDVHMWYVSPSFLEIMRKSLLSRV